MGIYAWGSFGPGSVQQSNRNPRLTVRCEYPDGSSPPSEVSFRLSPSYGLLTAREAHDWFLKMMAENEEFEVETDKPGEWPVSFRGETVRRVVVGRFLV